MLSQPVLCTTELACPLEEVLEEWKDSSDFSFLLAKFGVSEPRLELSQN